MARRIATNVSKHTYALPVFCEDASNDAVSLPQAANGRITASISAPLVPGIGRSPPVACRAASNANYRVESRCGAVVVGSGCLLPPLSSGGAQVPVP
jgi:hypothetical protein